MLAEPSTRNGGTGLAKTSTAGDDLQRGLAALRSGNLKEAERAFGAVLRAQPRHIAALNLLGAVQMQTGRFAEAEICLRRALAQEPQADATLYNYGIALKALRRPAEAVEIFTRALQANPSVAETWNNRGTVFNDLGRFDEAIADFDKAVALAPRYAEALWNKGQSLMRQKRFDDAHAVYGNALAARPDFAAAWLGCADALYALGRYDEAISSCERALTLNPALSGAWLQIGDSHYARKRFGEARAAFERMLALAPNAAEGLLRYGNVLFALDRYPEALAAYDKALAFAGDMAAAWLGRGNALLSLRRFVDALAAYDRALAVIPDLAEARLGRGNVFIELKRYDEALAAYDGALSSNPDLAEAWLGRGNVLATLRRYDDAWLAYDKAWRLNSSLKQVAGARLNAKLFLCDWSNLQAETAQLLAAIRADEPAGIPFFLLEVDSTAADQLQCARRFLREYPACPAVWPGEIYRHDRIRLAYLSADFHEHPVAALTAGLFEHHDRARFETIALSSGPEQDSPVRRRLKRAFEHFLDVSEKSDQEIAELIRQREVDVVVDLMGFSGHNRFGVLARRPAPIQVNYLGYAATMGSDFVDYILADATVIPEDQSRHYGEQVVWLPDSFMVNDARRAISERIPGRGECGLPEGVFVFCCFNNTYKLAPDTFAIWMRLLHAVPDSVLWLSDANDTAKNNLQREAETAGVSPQRLIFATRTGDVADHLARQRNADLFLDTLPYNAHTTSADALWAGVPVLTCLGGTFAGRVAASLLKAVGLDELITHSLDEYEALVLKLAREPVYLASIRDRLLKNRNHCPLFDTARTTRHIEAAYTMMWERYQRGQPAKLKGPDAKPIRVAWESDRP